MNIRITKRAKNEYLRLVDLFLEFSGPLAANHFCQSFEEKVNDICKFPEANFREPLLKDRKRIYRAKYVNRNYKIIYHASTTTIYISDIWDMRRDPKNLINRI